MIEIRNYFIIISLALFLAEFLLIKKIKKFDLENLPENLNDFNRNLIQSLSFLDEEGHYFIYGFFYVLFLLVAIYIYFVLMLLLSLQGFSVLLELYLIKQLRNH